MKFNFDDYLEDDDADVIETIREQVKIAIKTLEICWEELQKSNLPDEIKKSLLLNYKG